MTDNEIITALEQYIERTKNIKYGARKMVLVADERLKDILDLINRQQAEIERLQNENNQFADIGKMYSEIKTEAIKEFAERLKENLIEESYDDVQFFKVVGESDIDNLVKEMVGDTE